MTQTTNSKHQTVASTIYNQIGGKTFKMMTGSKYFLVIENGIKFHIPTNASKANRCTIELDLGSDTYAMTFTSEWIENMINPRSIVKEETVDLHWDQLQSEFTRVTGLLTKF